MTGVAGSASFRPARLAAGLAVVAVAALIGCAAWPRRGGKDDLLKTIRTAQVAAAGFYITLPVEGMLEAARSAPVVNTGNETQIVSALSDGTRLKAGDVVMRLNATQVQKEVDRLEKEVAEAEEKVRQEEAQAQKRVQNARGGLTKTQEAVELAKVQAQAGVEKAEAEVSFLERELEVAQGQSDKRKRLLEERLVPITEVEASEDEVRDKEHSLEAARRSLERARSDGETTKRLREMDLQTAKLELEQAEVSLVTSVLVARRMLAQKQSDLEDAQDRLDAMEVKAPVSGMLLLAQTWEDGFRPLRVGDQVWEGQQVASIIDPGEMWVRCDISEADIERVRVGQRARVSVPAIGAETLAGEVKAMDNLARERSRWEGGMPGKKVFAAVIRLLSGDQKIRPGMGATVEIVLERVSKRRSVPLEALFPKGKGYCVYRSEGGGYREVPVKVVKRNNEVAAVEGKLSEGDSVARERPPASLLLGAGRGPR